jgi:hypothetical protein
LRVAGGDDAGVDEGFSFDAEGFAGLFSVEFSIVGALY